MQNIIINEQSSIPTRNNFNDWKL